MKLGWWMLAGSALSCWGIVALLGDTARDLRLGVWLGMLGPLASTLCDMIVVNRAFRRNPTDLTGAMMKAFIAKMVFFGAYVVLVIKAGWVRPVPFAISFVGYFFALHFVEAFRLKRLTTTA